MDAHVESAAPARTAGFRLTVPGGFLLAFGVLSPFVLARYVGELAGLVPMVVLHFFLFCSVFRIRRSYELIWSAVFLASFTYFSWSGFSWARVLAVQLPLTALFLLLEIRSPRYHGIFAARLNPRLAEYLDGHSP